MTKLFGLIAGVTAATAATSITFEGNDAGIEGDLRHTSLDRINLGVAQATFYASVAGKIEGDKVVDQDTYEADASGKVNANAVFGCLFTGPFHMPQMYLANFDFSAGSSAEAVGKIDQEKNTLSGNGALSADMQASAGFMAHSAVDIQEIDADGKVVDTWMLMGNAHATIGLPPNLGTLWTAGDISNAADATVHSSTHIGKYNDHTLKITMVASDKAGQVSSGGLLTPSSVEITYDYTGPALADPTNHLRLRMGVASAKATAEASAAGSVSGAITADTIKRLKTGDDENAVWADFAKTAVSGTKDVNVVVEVTSFTDVKAAADASVEGSAAVDLVGDISGAMAAAAASGAGSAQASVKMVTVDFPPNVNTWFYDPTFGSGETPDPKMASSATALSVAFSVIVSVFAALL